MLKKYSDLRYTQRGKIDKCLVDDVEFYNIDDVCDLPRL